MNGTPYPWQRQQWLQVHAQVAQQRMPHAYLLSGIAGLGKLDFALAFAQAVLCSQRSEEGLACGTCRSCRLISAGTHPDRLLVSPEAAGKPIRIDAVRELIEFLTLSPSLGARRIVIVQPADALNVFAANSLLKTLEEPAPGALLLLVSDRPASLPATIRSRCQSLRFGPPSPPEGLSWLETSLESSAERRAPALARAGGAPLAALRYADDEALRTRSGLIAALERLGDSRVDPGTLADELDSTAADGLLDTLAAWLRDLIRVGSGAAVRENPDYAKQLHAHGKGLDLARLFECLDQTLRLRDMLSNGLNNALQLEALFIRYRAAVRHKH
ncbi:DNA polymerase III subunit delta' [Acidihalobacter aeolianus]|uniref:DNA polymerase III subunit delta' n=1 Tax=Acidihalobacter aeolianus TaxID=2792603 RepID=A0A1D8K7M4_9GAMM|nr:DNA polymerase III subunit delta' [Acidihalobacter aeolianus]AOV16965.1 DNA polymerase III subunit delta' [Acidihalobacter aeolianus]